MENTDPKGDPIRLTSKMKECSLYIPKDSNWADDAEENPGEEPKEVPTIGYGRQSSTHRVPYSGIRVPTSRCRSYRMLVTPKIEDTLKTVEDKMRQIALAVQSGENAALITDMNMGVPEIRDPTKHAKQNMKLLEREQYDAWEASQTMTVDINELMNLNGNDGDDSKGNGDKTMSFPAPRKQFTLPEIDWEKNKTTLPAGRYTLQKYTKRAADLAKAYSLQDSSICTPEHAVHFTLYHAEYLPLLRALSKVESARRDMTGDRETLSSLDTAEVQAMKMVNAIASRKVEEAYKELSEVTCSIARCQRVLRERENQIKAGVEGYRLKNYGGVGTKMK